MVFTHSPSVRLGSVVLAAVAALACQGRTWADAFLSFPNNATHDQVTILTSIANVPAGAGVVYDEAGGTDTIQIWNFQNLVYVGPVNVSATLDRIRDNYWMALHRNDGGFFNLLPDELPNVPRMGPDYYMEFVVWPGEFMDLAAGTYDPSAKPYDSITFPGPMRILLGRGGEVYFTGDHYGEGPAHLPAYYVNPTGPPRQSRFLIAVAPIAVSGTPLDVTITALGPDGNIDMNYQGTVTFTTTDPDPGVVLPADYTFASGDGGDNGVHTFPSGITLITPGDQTLTVTDTLGGITASVLITVGPGL